MGVGYPTGGSRVLAELIDEHGEAILSDLLHYYQVDLRDLFAEVPLSPRYVLSLITWLPTDSALQASRRGGHQFVGWDIDRYGMVAAINELRAANHLTLSINRDPKKARPRAPQPFPIPDKLTKKTTYKPGSFGAVAASMFAAQRRKKELMNG